MAHFYQPQCVVVDTNTLNTLPDRELASGFAEVIKYGLIRDAEFFEWQEKNMPSLMARCVCKMFLIYVQCAFIPAKAFIVKISRMTFPTTRAKILSC